MTRAISPGLFPRTTSAIAILGTLLACGARQPAAPGPASTPAPRILPLSRVIVLETSGPPPSDTSVSFIAGTERSIVLRHGPPENIVFARLTFGPGAFADSGMVVKVDVRLRPGVYGLDLITNLPLREGTLLFEYARFFASPASALQVFGSAGAFEQALAIGRLLPDGQIELLSSVRPAADHLVATIPAAGSYLVAAPQ
jgi:hypothetical protein